MDDALVNDRKEKGVFVLKDRDWKGQPDPPTCKDRKGQADRRSRGRMDRRSATPACCATDTWKSKRACDRVTGSSSAACSD